MRDLTWARSLSIGALAVLFAITACGGSSSGDSFAPDEGQITVHVTNQLGEPVQIRYVYGRATPSTLGTVSGQSEATFRFRYSGAGDLRLTGEFLDRRSGTSNPIVDLRAGETLEMTIDLRKELRLTRASPGS
jgi:hypothetical protein